MNQAEIHALLRNAVQLYVYEALDMVLPRYIEKYLSSKKPPKKKRPVRHHRMTILNFIMSHNRSLSVQEVVTGTKIDVRLVYRYLTDFCRLGLVERTGRSRHYRFQYIKGVHSK